MSSTSTSSLYSSTSRVTAMYSNIDTDALVQAACSTQQSRIDKANQKETTLTWKNEAMASLVDDVDTFTSTYCSTLGSSSMLKSSSYYAYSVTNLTDSTNSSVSIKASGSSAYTGDLSISVAQLAKNTTITSSTKTTLQSASSAVTATTANTTLSSLTYKNALTFDSDGNTSMTINGTSFTFNKNDTISDVLTEINSSSTGATMSFSFSKGSFSLTSNTAGSTGTVTASGDLATSFGLTTATGATLTTGTSSSGISKSGTISSLNTAKLSELSFSNALTFNSSGNIAFSINDVDFTFSQDTTLQSMLNTINNSDAGVTMSYSRLTDSFTIAADEGGEDSSIKIENTSGNAFGTNSAFGIATGTYSNGQNSISTITIDGVSKTVDEDSNELNYDGITYTLKKTTTEPLEFNVARDYSATVDSVQTFVDAFNKILTTLTDAVEFDTDTDIDPDDYAPLTDAQKEEMTDDEIEKWEAFGKDHLLRNDSTIESLISNLKKVFYSALGGTGMNTTDIGIATAGYYDDDAGLFVLDQDALKTALEENGGDVVSMFTNSTTGQRGLVYQIKDLLSAYTDTAEDSMTSNTDKIADIEDEVDTMEDKLSDLAEKYYAKYAAMETALSSLNSQSTALGSLLGS